jgi:hypothetical protein
MDVLRVNTAPWAFWGGFMRDRQPTRMRTINGLLDAVWVLGPLLAEHREWDMHHRTADETRKGLQPRLRGHIEQDLRDSTIVTMGEGSGHHAMNLALSRSTIFMLDPRSLPRDYGCLDDSLKVARYMLPINLG